MTRPMRGSLCEARAELQATPLSAMVGTGALSRRRLNHDEVVVVEWEEEEEVVVGWRGTGTRGWKLVVVGEKEVR